MPRRRLKFTLGTFMILVAVFGIGASVVTLIVLPRVRRRQTRDECRHNMRQIQTVSRFVSRSHSTIIVNGTAVSTSSVTIEIFGPAPVTNSFCPMARGTNRTFANSYDLHYFTSPPTCRICPDDHVLLPIPGM